MVQTLQLGPLVWPKAPSVDFLRHFVRENKTNGRKTNDRNSKLFNTNELCKIKLMFI
jgi:hypothetical protein